MNERTERTMAEKAMNAKGHDRANANGHDRAAGHDRAKWNKTAMIEPPVMIEPEDVLHNHLLGGRTATDQMAPSLLRGERKFPVEIYDNNETDHFMDTGAITRLATSKEPRRLLLGPGGDDRTADEHKLRVTLRWSWHCFLSM